MKGLFYPVYQLQLLLLVFRPQHLPHPQLCLRGCGLTLKYEPILLFQVKFNKGTKIHYTRNFPGEGLTNSTSPMPSQLILLSFQLSHPMLQQIPVHLFDIYFYTSLCNNAINDLTTRPNYVTYFINIY